ncbi:MAG TPA: hypothetical protein VFB67_06735 [Candidatus Polarisedimenticolaceae bacterium]|nr:hypothetical protein [Candidatus Polarisedimenticolaceae bacterium]
MPDHPRLPRSFHGRALARLLLALPGLLVCFALALLLGREAILVGVVADPSVIAGYPFGAENAPWNYRSAGVYAASCGVEAIVAGILGCWLILAARRGSTRSYLLAYACVGAFLGYELWL